jgi:predicted thioredoxin/glutaredoxin
VREAAARLNLDCEIVKTTDPLRFIGYNITAIPALVVDGRLVTAGRVPGPAEMERLLAGEAT